MTVRHHIGGLEVDARPFKVKQFVRHHTGGLRGLYGAPSPFWWTAIGGRQALRLGTIDPRSVIRRLTLTLVATCPGNCSSLTAVLLSCAI